MNARTRQAIDGAALLGGVFCIALGLIFFLDQLRVVHFGRLMGTYWPLIIVMIGVTKLFREKTVWSGLWLVGVGAWLQCIQLDLYGLTYSNSWPLLLILWGGGLVLRTFFETASRSPRNGGTDGRPEGRHES